MRIAKCLLVTLAVSFTSTVLAADGNIAVVDFAKAIFSTEVAKARLKQKKGESDFAALQGKYESTVANMKALKQDIESKGMTWSTEDAAEAQQKMAFYRQELELVTRKIQSDQQALQNSIVQELRPKAGEALQEIIDEEGIVLLISAEAVVTAAPSLDVTAKLTDRLNKKTK
ncbi:MAG: OmpH family outer membrane protein [Porticoccaceae bacterium]